MEMDAQDAAMFEKAIWKKSNGSVMMGRVMKIRRWKPKHSVTMPAVLSALSTARLSVFLSLSLYPSSL